MSYYKQLLQEISVQESAVNCAACTDLYKCCTYRPFIANFLIGEIGETLFDFDLKNWDLTICGIAPNLNYRKRFKGRSGWGFGTDATLLCSFYNQKSGGCGIWQSRPSVCRTFFCKSSYHEAGTHYWKTAEELTWVLEWLLVEDFLFHEGWTILEINNVKAYLHENALDASTSLPEESIFTNIKDAVLFYQKAAEYIDNLPKTYVQSLLGSHFLSQKEQVLALKEKLR